MKKYFDSLIWILRHPNNKDKVSSTLLKLFLWKVNQLIFHLPFVVNISREVRYIAYPRSSFGSLVIYTKLPEYFEMRYFERKIRINDVVIDVGAHMGDYSLLAASKAKHGKVYAFEPSVEALRVLYENISINKFQDVIDVRPFIVSDVDGYIEFVDEDVSEISHIDTKVLSEKTKRVKSVTLDKFIKKMSINRIKFLKIDVEGAEYKVLKGLRDTLKRKIVKNIIIEINKDSKRYGYDPQKSLDYLSGFGYRCYIFNESGSLKEIVKFTGDKKYINVLAKTK